MGGWNESNSKRCWDRLHLLVLPVIPLFWESALACSFVGLE